MELRHLRYFLAIAEELNFARAAKRVHIEQSPFSRAIKELEHQLGVQLLIRTSRSTRLTPAGQLFQLESQRILDMANQAQTKVRNVASGSRGLLRIGTADGMARAQLIQLMAQYRHAEPELELQLFHQPIADLIYNLQYDRLDIGIATPTLPQHYCGLSMEPLWSDQLIGVLSAEHPLAESKLITLNNIAHLPLILGQVDRWQSVYQLIVPHLGTSPCGLRKIHYASGHESMLAMVESGYGLGFALASQINGIIRPNITVMQLDTRLPSIKNYALWSTTTPPSTLKNFIRRANSIGVHHDFPALKKL